jgi:uncharacterized metal-binding protein YceD (DUF177 family)
MSEFSRPMTLAEAKRQAAPLLIAADADERAALAKRFSLPALDRLEASIAFAIDGERIRLTGEVSGDAVQTCVATGEPVPASVAAPLDITLVPEGPAGDEEEVELDSADLDIETYPPGGRFDVGEIVAGSFALALDPWPRRPDADAFLKAKGVLSEGEAGSFGALAALRDQLGKPGQK